MFQTIEKRIQNFRRYYLFENKRPLLGFFWGSDYPLKRFNASGKLPQDRPLQPEDFNVGDYLADYDRLFEIHEACGGDFIFAGDAFWGIPWLEAFLGCELWANHQTGSIIAKSLKDVKRSEQLPLFDDRNPWAIKAAEFLDSLSGHSNGRYPLGTTRMRGISDLLAAVYGNEAFIYKSIESPQEVHKVCEKLTDLWIAFGKFQLAHIPLFHGGVGSFYYNMWMPADSVWHQEDAAALLSPRLYEEFILPCDKRIAEAFAGCFMHMHPTGFCPYRQLLKTKMTCLELHIDATGPSPEQLYSIHQEILAETPLLIWGHICEKGLDWIFSRLPSRGLAVHAVVDSPKQAAQYWDKYIHNSS